MSEFQPTPPAINRPDSSGPGAVFRVLTGMLGILIILLGLYFSVKLFFGIYSALKSPQNYEQTFNQWEQVLQSQKTGIEVGDQPLARIFVVLVLGGGVYLLCRIAIAIMVAGGRIVSWSSGDREAVRRIIRESTGVYSKQN